MRKKAALNKHTLNTWGLGAIIAIFLLFLGVTGYQYVKEDKLSMDETFYEGTKITIYNQGIGLVKQSFQYELPMGVSNLLIEGVASRIDTSSVKLSSANGDLSLIEQNYQYDLVNSHKLMEKFVGKEVSVLLQDPREEVTGKLLSYNSGQAIIETDDGQVHILSSSEYILKQVDTSELLLKPTLDWIVSAPEGKTYDLTMMYITKGMTWTADYILLLNEDDTMGEYKGWVTIDNQAGATFKEAELKLVAGDVNVIQERAKYDYAYEEDAVMVVSSAGAPQFVEEGLFEYHMYTLQRPSTVKDKEQKQISLLEADNMGVEKKFVYTGGSDVAVKVVFENSEENGMGIPLPKGKVKVFKEDSSQSLQFVGEDYIDHTPKDEEIELTIGNAFDIVGERKQIDYKKETNYRVYTYEITLRNHKEEDVVVNVEEYVGGWREWTITDETYDHEKDTQQKVIWKIPVKADGESTLTYTIRYKSNY